ncbi:hypothetical protein [Microvirga puerhi]|uniref:Uncharacterized protein n=1 Tax=Microvirga puerhi TaxID=2876078 RepID=A0ABS7VRB1_9HYPH|nr:hypothetical protein [Microvirga puerhi]MBZ6078086.1 hypothetical protein [Microvirga puerhi]
MTNDNAWRRDIKHFLDGARYRVLHYTGLYSDEDLIGAVLHACREAAGSDLDLQLGAAKSIVEEHCRTLVRVADRFSARDFALIAASRARTLAAIDMFQDIVLQERRIQNAALGHGTLLKRRAL